MIDLLKSEGKDFRATDLATADRGYVESAGPGRVRMRGSGKVVKTDS